MPNVNNGSGEEEGKNSLKCINAYTAVKKIWLEVMSLFSVTAYEGAIGMYDFLLL